MMDVLAWFPSAFHVSTALGGGKGPVRWDRELVRKTAELSVLRRGGAWVVELGAVHPRLCYDPLLGATLTALVDQTEQTQETQAKTIRPEKARFARWENSPEMNRKKATASASILSPFQPKVSNRQSTAKQKTLKAAPSGDPAKTLRKVQAQAGRSLLNRLAGGKFAFERNEQKQARSFPLKVNEKASEAGLGFVLRNTAHQDLLSRLAERAGRALNLEQLDAAGRAKRAGTDAQVSGQSPFLTEQWTIPLYGTSASSDLLNRLVQEGLLKGGENSETVKRVSSGRQPPSLEKPVPSSSFWRPDEPSVLSGRWDGWRVESADGGSNFESETKLPESVRPGFPFIAPESGISGPLPVAAATARRGAREEAKKAIDDLDVLAAKIKQILDEQARRHGIDV